VVMRVIISPRPVSRSLPSSVSLRSSLSFHVPMLICSRPRAQKYPVQLYCPSLRVRPPLFQSTVLINSPGWVWTPLAGASSGKDKPNAPWTAEQTVDYMFEKVFDNGDFYVICPDNEVTSVSISLYNTT
jgi:hypothetical protein